MALDTDKAYRAGRSLLADHIRGARKVVRKQRAELDGMDNKQRIANPLGTSLRAARLEGSLFEAEHNLRGLRDLSGEFRGRQIG